MTSPLSSEEKQYLLHLARLSIEAAVNGKSPPAIDKTKLTDNLRKEGTSFVTLTKRGALRGCIGALEAYQPLAEDVREHAASAAVEDYRFPNVQPGELAEIEIEISRLTTPIPLTYSNPEDLLDKLQPGVDGVILKDGFRRATFLPQVWNKLPDKVKFLENLCYKMGAEPNAWRKKHMDVFIYHVEEFKE